MWINTAWQHISLEVTVKGFKKCCVSNGMDGTDDDICGMGVKRMGMLKVSIWKMWVLTGKMETVTPIDKGRQNLTCIIH